VNRPAGRPEESRVASRQRSRRPDVFNNDRDIACLRPCLQSQPSGIALRQTLLAVPLEGSRWGVNWNLTPISPPTISPPISPIE
jgi:hypothetical protein